MASEVLYGRTLLKPYFNLQKFEDTIYNKPKIRAERIKRKKRIRILDKLLVLVCIILLLILSAYITVAVRVIDLISMCFLFIAPTLPKAKTVIRYYFFFITKASSTCIFSFSTKFKALYLRVLFESIWITLFQYCPEGIE